MSYSRSGVKMSEQESPISFPAEAEDPFRSDDPQPERRKRS